MTDYTTSTAMEQTIWSLTSSQATNQGKAGSKASRLAELLAAGFPVPSGVVVPIDVIDASRSDGEAEGFRAAVAEALEQLGDRAVAVRSSAVEEDRADASFAGLYESVLDVSGVDEVLAALDRVIASAGNDRVRAYAADAGELDDVDAAESRDGGVDSATGMAVLIQVMVPATSAGVAFTANPVTGDRAEVVVTAVNGLGERLVSGAVSGEQWVLRGDNVHDAPAEPGVLDAATAKAVGALARSVESHYGSPQDIEWAIADGQVHLLQARPMTALPPVVTWETSAKGWWRRDFRFGEWLPEPVTPLFESWFFTEQEGGFVDCCIAFYGTMTAPPFHTVVNGWCYCSDGMIGPKLVLGMIKRPKLTFQQMKSFATIGKDPAYGEKHLALPPLQLYRDELLPRYRERITAAEQLADTDDSNVWIDAITALCRSTGELTLSLVGPAGYAGKAEFSLGDFYRKHLREALGGNHLSLLGGLTDRLPTPPHAVTSLDWIRPTLGEVGGSLPAPPAETHAHVVAVRVAAEAACRAELAERPKLLVTFNEFLDIAQRYAIIREELTGDFTLAWPVIRRGILLLGERLVAVGVIEEIDDVFFLTRPELVDNIVGSAAGVPISVSMATVVAERRTIRTAQARLAPPLALGKAVPGLKKMDKAIDDFRAPLIDNQSSEELVRGMPSSAGRATGPVRVVRSIDDFAKVQPGDVLVAPITAPAWTPLFGKVAAVVTDSGSIAAHASIVAREYGLPAVVGTGDATTRLHDGQLVTVDGDSGTVVSAV